MELQQFKIGSGDNSVTVSGIAAAERELCNRHAKRDQARRAMRQVKDGVMSAVYGGIDGTEIIPIERLI